MSPLARSLLALACAALLHASSADVRERVRAVLPDWNTDTAIADLKQGILDDKYAMTHELPPILFHPPNETDFFMNVPNVAKPNESLIGQVMWVLGDAKKITLKPKTKGKHSPIHVHCEPRCSRGVVVVLADQYVIPKIL